jgi:diguanylate cyclase (GGDEF)-like protein
MTTPTPESPLEALLEAAGDLAFHLNGSADITHAAGLNRTPGLAHLAQGHHSFFDLFPESAHPAVREAFEHAIRACRRVTLQAELRAEFGTQFEWLLSGYDTGTKRGVMAAGRRVEPADASGLGMGTHDALTGLPNRMLLQDRCERAIELGMRRDSSFALLLLDLKAFTKVNEAFGVKTGDDLLRQVSQRLVSHVRASDTVARIGPDEFALLLPDMADPETMMKLGRQLMALIETVFVLDETEVHISASMGFALHPIHGVTHEALLNHATVALKEAKQAGGGRCVMFDQASRTDARTLLTLESALHQGVANGELYLHYQPLVDITGTIYGAEALMRWNKGGTTPVSPAQFIPVAEECGLIQLLGSWALKAATAGIARINRDHGTELTISVNVSPRQFRSANFLQTVTDALAFSGLPAHLLQLEITEGILMSDPEAAERLLSKLTDAGMQIAIDDFGTGYSSLAYLKRFSLSSLKIDRSFVKDLPAPKDLAICRSVFSMSRELGLKSVAEGVETEEQWHILRDAGCDAIQGYFFGKPQSLEQFEIALAAQALPQMNAA